MDETQKERRKRQLREATAWWRAKNQDKVKAYVKAHRAANLDEMRRLDRETKKRWYAANKEEARTRAAAYAAKNPEQARVRTAEWRKANPDRVKELAKAGHDKRKENWTEFLEYERARYHKNPTEKLRQQQVYRSDPSFRPRAREYHREYRKLHPEFTAIKNASRKAARLNATPPWCDLDAVALIYRKARQLTIDTGIAHEVDHIVPLCSKHVCGLHIPQNLQILTRNENRRKHNKLIHAETGNTS